MDKLDKIFTRQLKLQKALGYSFDTMTLEERAAYIREYTLHMEHEMHEMLQELPFFKSWKRYETDDMSMAFAYDKAREEFVDALHFFLNVAMALGFTSDELAEGFINKNNTNKQRQLQPEYKKCVEAADEATISRETEC